LQCQLHLLRFWPLEALEKVFACQLGKGKLSFLPFLSLNFPLFVCFSIPFAHYSLESVLPPCAFGFPCVYPLIDIKIFLPFIAIAVWIEGKVAALG